MGGGKTREEEITRSIGKKEMELFSKIEMKNLTNVLFESNSAISNNFPIFKYRIINY